MATAPCTKEQMYHDAFVTALESGSYGTGSWASVVDYRWSAGDGRTPDLQGFEARVIDHETDRGAEPLVINREVIERGFQRLADGTCTFGTRPMEAHVRARYAGWLAVPDAADLDGPAADLVVQSGLFGDIVYG